MGRGMISYLSALECEGVFSSHAPSSCSRYVWIMLGSQRMDKNLVQEHRQKMMVLDCSKINLGFVRIWCDFWQVTSLNIHGNK